MRDGSTRCHRCRCLTQLHSDAIPLVNLSRPGSPCFPHIVSNPNIDLHLFPSSTTSLTTVSSRAYRLLLAPIKVLSQMYQLARILLFQLHARPDVLLVQNPPSIPTLLLALIAAWVHGAALLIDWHNFGYSLLGLNFGPTSFIVNLAHLYEQAMGQQADGHLCVTSSMQKWMQGRWKIDARVLHDRAQEHFRRLTTSEAHALFTSLMVEQGLMPQLRSQEWMAVDDARAGEASDEYVASLASADAAATPFTYLVDGEACWRPDRPSIVISSTSWTADEDFTILARAIQMHDEEIAQSRSAPADSVESTESTLSKRGAKQQGGAASDSAAAPSRPLPRAVYIITGKGPMRDAFVASIAAMPLRFSSVHTLFVSSAEYPQLLGAADLGISLHYSSSGLDLPMKVVDMFGAGLPVCAVNFQTYAPPTRTRATTGLRDCETDAKCAWDTRADVTSSLPLSLSLPSAPSV